MERVAQNVAPEPAVRMLPVDGDNPLNRRKVGPGAHEISEHDACVPGVIRDH